MGIPTLHDGGPVATAHRQTYFDGLIAQLKAKRIAMGISQEKLGEKMGIADRLVNKWECGDRVPSAFMLHCWCSVLGCELQVKSTSTLRHKSTITRKEKVVHA